MKKPTAPPAKDRDPDLQGEGNYSAARRHRASVKKFIDAGRVDPAARQAAPGSLAEDDEMKASEASGRSRARR